MPFLAAAANAAWRFFSSRARDVFLIQPMMIVRPATRQRAGKTNSREGGGGTIPSKTVPANAP